MTPQKKKTAYNPSSPAVEQAAQLLVFLGKQKEADMSLTDICKAIGIHKSKGFSLLNALSRFDLIVRNEASKTYSLGPGLIPLAQRVKERFDISAVAKGPLRQLANEAGTSVLLGIVCNDQFYISDKYDGNEMLSLTIRQYQSLHITHGAHGKAIFAFLSPEEQERILDAGPVFFHGPGDAFDRERLDQELILCRENGYAVDNGEQTPGTRAVSAPVFDHKNRVTAGIVLVGTFPETEFKPLGTKIAATARAISRLAGAGLP